MSMSSTAAKIVTMSVYTVLEGEHNEVAMLFKAIEASPDVATGRTALFEKLCNELKSHTVAEQKAVYDKVKTHVGSKTLIEHAEREHQSVEHLLNELESMDITTDAWMLKLSELKQAVEHHVREEESKMFDRMHQMFTDEEARGLADEFQKLKNAELKKLAKA
jgi:hypothetical protein